MKKWIVRAIVLAAIGCGAWLGYGYLEALRRTFVK